MSRKFLLPSQESIAIYSNWFLHFDICFGTSPLTNTPQKYWERGNLRMPFDDASYFDHASNRSICELV